jgi:RNA polymerase sigma factor (sigma-70 family)
MKNILSIKNYDQTLDLSLITKALSGNKKSLNELLIIHQDFIFNVALKFLNNVSDVEDVTQEILIKIVTNLSKFNASKSSIRTWVYRITFNYMLDMKKSSYEKNKITFPYFFDILDSLPDVEIEKEEHLIMGKTIEEARVSCTSGMLMCLNREQRMLFIIGDIFKIDHHLASEIFEITPVNFRKKLSRARTDLKQWMQNKCGLIDLNNPCRCSKKTKTFIKNGWVDPKNLKWLSNYKIKINELANEKMPDLMNAHQDLVSKIYRDQPFKTSFKANELYQEILNHKNFSKILDL